LQVRRIWADNIHKKDWGWKARVRIQLWKRYNRRPTKAELDEAFGNVDNKAQDVTPEDIEKAYSSGWVVSTQL
jgi:hypothetical protein